jgi:hypothetical protein
MAQIHRRPPEVQRLATKFATALFKMLVSMRRTNRRSAERVRAQSNCEKAAFV